LDRYNMCVGLWNAYYAIRDAHLLHPRREEVFRQRSHRMAACLCSAETIIGENVQAAAPL